MVGVRRLIASRVGAAVVDGHEMRAPADDRRQPRAIVLKKKKKKNSQSLSQSNLAITVPYGTVISAKDYICSVNVAWPY